MFSGINEILVILLVISGLFLVPRMMKPRPAPQKIVLGRYGRRLSWMQRLGIVASVFWPVAAALYFKPWQQDITPFALVGIGPVVIGWSLKWVLAGTKNKR